MVGKPCINLVFAWCSLVLNLQSMIVRFVNSVNLQKDKIFNKPGERHDNTKLVPFVSWSPVIYIVVMVKIIYNH
jgi:hypothetical protein